MTDLFGTVRKILVDLIAVRDEEVKPDSSLIEDLGADSLDIVNFIEALEKEFSRDGFVLEITEEDADGVETMQQVIDLLKRKGVRE